MTAEVASTSRGLMSAADGAANTFNYGKDGKWRKYNKVRQKSKHGASVEKRLYGDAARECGKAGWEVYAVINFKRPTEEMRTRLKVVEFVSKTVEHIGLWTTELV